MEKLYPYIYKRKSFHLFRDNKTKECYKDKYHIKTGELEEIYNVFKLLKPLDNSIKVDIKIVKEEFTNCQRGAEYCILFYSEKKNNYLQNIGFIGEQLDLYLVSKDIGTLWYGVGKTDALLYNDLSFITMMAICKVPTDSFRKDMFKSKRKTLEDIWDGNMYFDIASIARFAPSSCNTQPWFIREDNDILEIYRYKNPAKRGIMPIDKVVYQNRIDIGIFIYYMTVLLENSNIQYKLVLFNDNDENNNNEYTINAKLKLNHLASA